MKMKYVIAVAAVVGLLSVPSAWAINITIPDGVGSGTGWYGAQEDQEVEPGAATGQAWDLEAFDLNGTQLTLWAGYNLKSGYGGYDPGDIFIDVDGDAVWGIRPLPRSTSNAAYKWDYVIDIRYSTASPSGSTWSISYDVYALDDDSVVKLTTDFGGAASDQFDWSNPWRYSSGGDYLESGTAVWQNGIGANGLGLVGSSHNTLTVDVGFLGSELDGALFSYTMECGNDGIKGRAPSVPDGGLTLILLGMGLTGLAIFQRKKN